MPLLDDISWCWYYAYMLAIISAMLLRAITPLRHYFLYYALLFRYIIMILLLLYITFMLLFIIIPLYWYITFTPPPWFRYDRLRYCSRWLADADESRACCHYWRYSKTYAICRRCCWWHYLLHYFAADCRCRYWWYHYADLPTAAAAADKMTFSLLPLFHAAIPWRCLLRCHMP